MSVRCVTINLNFRASDTFNITLITKPFMPNNLNLKITITTLHNRNKRKTCIFIVCCTIPLFFIIAACHKLFCMLINVSSSL